MLLALAPCAALLADAPLSPEAPQPNAERLIAWHPIGGSSPRAENRHVGWRIPQQGWNRYVRLHVQPQLRLGVRRVLIHNPFGHEPITEPMAFDQYAEAQEAGLTGLTDGFTEAWKPVVDGAYTNGEAVEVICYLGSIDIDRDFVKMRAGEPTGWSARWVQRVFTSIEPALSSGMSFGFDSSSDLPADSAEFKLIELIDALGHRCYVESRPLADKPHLWRFNVISTHRHWFRSDPDKHEGADHNARNRDLKGEIVVLLNRVKDPRERFDEVERLWHETSHTVATRLDGEGSAVRLRRWLQPPPAPHDH